MELWFSEKHTSDVQFSLRVDRQLYSAESEYQKIDIFDSREFGRVLVLDGDIMLTERDEFVYDEMIVHVPMAVHPRAENILGHRSRRRRRRQGADEIPVGHEHRPCRDGPDGSRGVQEVPPEQRL